MSRVPENPVFTASIPYGARLPTNPMPEVPEPKGFNEFNSSKQNAWKSIVAFSAEQEIFDEEQRQQRARVLDRCPAEQWLDENEREWYAMDDMLRSRPWATKRDEPFKYPFREATTQMRQAEGDWLGDDIDHPARPWTRADDSASCEVLFHMRPVAEYPPFRRVFLFLPEFGTQHSFDSTHWEKLAPMSTCDVWVVSWQGWRNWDEMFDQVFHKMLSFADAVSTVWYGHSMGALVAYELLKRFEKHRSPNLPVGLVVSGCPAPHLFQEQYRPYDTYQWLASLQGLQDFEQLEQNEYNILVEQFQCVNVLGLCPIMADAMKRGITSRTLVDQHSSMLPFTDAQKQAIINDLKVMRSYRFDHEQNNKSLCVPVVAICHAEDELVAPAAVEAWKEYNPPDKEFDFCKLEDVEDNEKLADQGHGYAYKPCPTVINKVNETSERYQLLTEVDDILPDIGPVDGDIPDEVDCVIVGAGLAGITQAKIFAESGKSVIIFDRYRTAGGIWMFYANKFSRVNSSEPAYRLVNFEGVGTRPNQDHSPTHDILRDCFTMAAQSAYGRFRCHCDVTKVQQRNDKTFDITVKHLKRGTVHDVHAKVCSLHVNRRIGQRRDITYPGSEDFRGDEVYGYANEVLGLKFWGKRVIVVGAGAFAFENLRTAVEHGAKHCTILGRRAGTTCPKWIDMIAFLRPLDKYYNTSKSGNMISFDAWRKCYTDAGLKTPECWDEGLLKPHNHTVSVSDLCFIGGYHGMVDLRVGEIERFRPDGHGVILKDGSRMDADIVIKATGFHLNTEVPGITGFKNIHSNGLLAFNLNYGAEPLLDGGQFGSQKGRIAKEYEDTPNDAAIAQGSIEAAKLGVPDVIPRQNPFGSSYVGGMLAAGYNFRWLVEHPEHQEELLRTCGKPPGHAVEAWVSQLGTNKVHTLKRCLAGLAA